jgi:hypothetical protein
MRFLGLSILLCEAFKLLETDGQQEAEWNRDPLFEQCVSDTKH